jgi:hypothetical protein
MMPCPAALPGSLARQPCPAALPDSLLPRPLLALGKKKLDARLSAEKTTFKLFLIKMVYQK